MNRKLLLVEGSNDKHVILAIQGQYPGRLVDIGEIFDCGDDGRLLDSLPVRLKESDITNLGVVMDADENISRRWAKIRAILISSGYGDTPEEPRPNGTVIDAPPNSLLPKFGVWLMPDNSKTGILEDFLKFLVPAECPLFTYAAETVSALPESRFSRLAHPKALIHTWLAWQKDPGRPLGQAITAKYLQAGAPEAMSFMDWMKRVFS